MTPVKIIATFAALGFLYGFTRAAWRNHHRGGPR